jgi:adenine deaminase
MGRHSHAAIERIKKIASLPGDEAIKFMMSERGQTPQKCSVQLCGCTAACEIAIAGEWFPVCRAHAMNRLAPRRALSNAEVSDPATKTP